MLSKLARSNVSALIGKRSMSKITAVKGREIIDSRGNPTVEVDITTAKGTFTASVPSGASTGAYEAVELRDGGSRYLGKGVLKAVNNVNTVLADKIIGMDAADQRAIDNAMLAADGSPNKGNLGANAILGGGYCRLAFMLVSIFILTMPSSFSTVSLAASKAGAASRGVPLWQHYADIAGNSTPYTLPVPCFNVINGGEHAGNKLPFQEFFVIPTGAANFTESMTIGCEVFHTLKKVIKAKFGGDATLIGGEFCRFSFDFFFYFREIDTILFYIVSFYACWAFCALR
jgi:enolase